MESIRELIREEVQLLFEDKPKLEEQEVILDNFQESLVSYRIRKLIDKHEKFDL